MFDDLDPRSSDTREPEAPDFRGAEALDPRDVFTRNLDLPRGLDRERVHVPEHRQDCHLRGSDVRTLPRSARFGSWRPTICGTTRVGRGTSDMAIWKVCPVPGSSARWPHSIGTIGR